MTGFSIRHRVQAGSGVYPASYPTDTGGSYPQGYSGSKLTTHLHPDLKLRVSGAIPPLPQYDFME